MVRLMDCLNFIKIDDKLIFDSIEHKDFKGKKIIHWLPKENNIKIKIKMLDAKDIKAIAEKTVENVQVNDIVQFERVGFARCDSKNSFWYTMR